MSLNPQQLKVVEHRNGPLLVLAGAGTGKTHTLTHRVYHLLQSGVSPSAILLLTFTRKASEEMLSRVQELQRQDSILLDERINGGTFHSIAFKYLCRYSNKKIFQLIDESDQSRLLKILCEDRFESLLEDFPIRKLISFFGLQTNTRESLGEILRRQNIIYDSLSELESLAETWRTYKQNKQIFDYDDILQEFYELLISSKGEAIRRDFQFVMIDEFQDCTRLQLDILHELCREHQNVMLVGDDCQSIYSFRGAEPRQLNCLEEFFPSLEITMLSENYRSTVQVLNFSNKLIHQATEVVPKELCAAGEPHGSHVKILSFANERVLADALIDMIQEKSFSGTSLSQQAVLYRSSHHTIALEMRLLEHQFSYQKSGGLKISESKHLKDFLSLLVVLYSPSQESAWLRVLELIPGVGAKTAQKNLGSIIKDQELTSLKWPKKSLEEIESLQELIISDKRNLFSYLLKALDWYIPFIVQKDSSRRIDDLNQLVYDIADYGEVEQYLRDVFLDRESSKKKNQNDSLMLSTIHSAKGKEWDTVYVLNSSDQALPGHKAAQYWEEELRLLYVACTRAKKDLVLLWPEKSLQDQKNDLSRFLESVHLENDFFATPETIPYSETKEFKEEPSDDLLYCYDDSEWN